MRILSAAALSALVLTVAALPATAQEDPNLPGVRVTIQPKSYLNPGTQARPRSVRDIEKNGLNQTFTSSNYYGIPGFERFPLADPLDLPYNGMRYVLRAPDRVR